MKIAIVGAGLAGILPAYYFTKAGHQVTVFDKERYAAMQTSFANGGQISVSNSEVWTTWANVGKGVKWLMQKDAPLLIRPSLDPAKFAWLFKFMLATARGDSEKRTLETIKLGIESRELYGCITSEEELSFSQSNCGIMHIYWDEAQLKASQQLQTLFENAGCGWEMINRARIAELEPALERRSVFMAGGAWTPDDSVGDAHKFCVGLLDVLQNKYNVMFLAGCPHDDLNELTAEFDAVVVAAGVGSPKLAKSIGDRLPIYPVKGYSVTINLPESQERADIPKISILDDKAKIVTSTLGNKLRIAGTAELTGHNYDITRSRIEPLLKWSHSTFPQINTREYSQWACLRPMTPDMLPIVKRSKKNPKVFYHTGHGHLGFTVAPATAQHLLKLINQL